MLDISLISGLCECRVCGAHASMAATHIEMNWDYVAVESIGPRLIGDSPICRGCAQQWHQLEEQVGRPVDVEEFLLVVLHKANKRKKSNKISGPCQAECYDGTQCTNPATQRVGNANVCAHHKRQGFTTFKPEKTTFAFINYRLYGDIAEAILGSKVDVVCPDCGCMCDLNWKKQTPEQNETKT